MKIYRGTRDFLPHHLNHRKLKDAVYGEATYFALSFEDALRYSGGGHGYCAVVTTYEINLSNILTISSQDWNDVSCISNASEARGISSELQKKLNLSTANLAPKNLSKIISENKFDAALLKGKFEGGEQLILPPNEIEPVIVEYEVFLGFSMLGRNKDNTQVELFIHALLKKDIKAMDNGYQIIFKLSPLKLKEITPLLEFLEYCRHHSFLSVDYEKCSTEEYSE